MNLALGQELENARLARAKLEAKGIPSPGYFSAKGLFNDPHWCDSYLAIAIQWPKSCTISVKDRQLLGLARSIAFMWEPSILNLTDLSFEVGFKAEQITETIKIASAVIGLAHLDNATKVFGTKARLNHNTKLRLVPIRKFFSSVPQVFVRSIVLEDPTWFNDLLVVTKPAYELESNLLTPKLHAYIGLTAAAVLGWEEGTKLYARACERFGATKKEVHDVVKAVFKTSVSDSMAAGFRYPCHIPRLEKYRTILSSYVENGALSPKTKYDRLSWEASTNE